MLKLYVYNNIFHYCFKIYNVYGRKTKFLSDKYIKFYLSVRLEMTRFCKYNKSKFSALATLISQDFLLHFLLKFNLSPPRVMHTPPQPCLLVPDMKKYIRQALFYFFDAIEVHSSYFLILFLAH